MTKITPVLMSGGAGTRLWPLSRRARPKQFHALGGERTLIQETALRVTGEMFGPPQEGTAIQELRQVVGVRLADQLPLQAEQALGGAQARDQLVPARRF